MHARGRAVTPGRDELDITDDFRDAFIGSLNVVTTDQGHFSAQTAERRDANLTIFRRGIYTACAPCIEHPERPPLWQIKAARIIHNEAEHTEPADLAVLEMHTRFLRPGKTFCAHPPAAIAPLESGLACFRDEFERHIGTRGCPWRA